MKLDVSTKEGYLLATAMRGPDVQYLKLKYIITGWIRAQCGVTYEYCTVRANTLTEEDIREAKEEVDQLCKDYHARPAMHHWLRHMTNSVEMFPSSAYQGWLARFIRCLFGVVCHQTEASKALVYKCLDDYPTK